MATLYTIGHSTHSAAEFAGLLEHHGIRFLVDVRSHPGSRKFQHFNAERMALWLPEHGIVYCPMKSLGGRRKPDRDSVNSAWQNEGFRGFADYMQRPEFALALDDLLKIATRRRTAIMCAEAVPWRCHRNLISDALVLLRGTEVRHITGRGEPRPHVPTPFASVENGKLIYPPGQPELPLS